MVYVDDFKMSGPDKARPGLSKKPRKNIDMDEPVEMKKCLGCNHKKSKGYVDGKPVTFLTYDMRGYMKQSVSLYCELANVEEKSLPKVKTPFLNTTTCVGSDGHVINGDSTRDERACYNAQKTLEPLPGEDPGTLASIAAKVL